MRTERQETRKTCPHEGCQCRMTVWVVDITCDGCGKAISDMNHEDSYAHALEIGLDSLECVSFYRRRDYCPACLKPVWDKINEAIIADPGKERDRDYDREYG